MRTLLVVALLAAPVAHAAFKCTDKNGRTHFGDTPPPQCESVTMYEVSPSGAVIRRIEPSLTPEQIAAKKEETERRKAEERAAAEQRRKDIALLSTYASEQDVDTSRDINLKPIEARITSAEERIKAVEKRQKQLSDEMEFYRAGSSKSGGKSKGPPAQLVQDLEYAKNEKATLEKSIAAYQKEMVEVRERYEADKKRWVALKELQREGKLDLRSPQEIEAARKSAQQQGKPSSNRR